MPGLDYPNKGDRDDVVDFYRSCDWLVGSMHKGKYIVASDSIDESKFDGEIW